MKPIEEILKEDESKSYKDRVTFLREFRDSLTNLSVDSHTIIQALCSDSDTSELISNNLKYVILEYSAFSYTSIHMLLDALIRNHDWESLKNELKENIEEERGSMTRNIPHLEMMRRGYSLELGIDTDSYVPSFVTQNFLNRMTKIFRHNDNAYSAGALLAFEGTAIQEFHIVEKIVNKYCNIKDIKISEDSLTSLYIKGHKDFEIGHENHLYDAIAPYINEDNLYNFSVGYLHVCVSMSTWWNQLSTECMLVLIDEEAILKKVHEPEIEKKFKKK